MGEEHRYGYDYGYHGATEDEGLSEDVSGYVEGGETGGEGRRDVDVSGYLGEEAREELDGDGLPEDPARIELMERLCDMVQRISSARVGGGMEADVIDVLHDKIDEMEGLLAMAEDAAEAEDTAHAALGEVQEHAETLPEEETEVENEGRIRVEFYDVGSRSGETSRGSGRPYSMPSFPSLPSRNQDMLGLASPAPWLASSFRFSELSLSPTHEHPELTAATNLALEAAKQAAQAQAEMTERVAAEAEELNTELVKIMKTLQARKEESDHLHALLVERAEGAATRILDLEKEVSDLEDDILSNESELRHLRLKIRAVETLCHEFVPPEADPELFRSIENWKADWVLVRDRMLERKRGRRDRRARLHRPGCVLGAARDDESSTLTSLGGLSMSVSLLGLSPSLRKAVTASSRRGF
ncbi:hypothetical protein BT67DRAFT_418657 [Trichocladium antarcticum]|uniref:Uncharacterized protein n=1 Tax=Trichocladium antarcticum TaxID=1450529 RepID=A0AAN6UMR1_9PEZI|nr:hypothetical protein BT67DRAFT_418657 [Trichocladium antarcticum]